MLAKTITTIASVGEAALLPASPLLLGGIATDSITAYQDTGTGPAIKTLTTKGDFNTSSLTAERGVGTVTIGRLANASFLIADDAFSGDINVGRISTLTASAGMVRPLRRPPSELSRSQATPRRRAPPPATSSATYRTASSPRQVRPRPSRWHQPFTVARQLQTNSLIQAPFGITTVAIGRAMLGGSQIVTDNPGLPAAGFLTTLTVGDINGATIRTGNIGTMKVTGNVGLGFLGNIINAAISADGALTTPSGTPAIGSVTVAGDYSDSTLDAPLNVGSVNVGGRITVGSGTTRILASYAPGNKLGVLTARAGAKPLVRRPICRPTAWAASP